jgi:anti-sigma28 factor (negative regulator of flagellin synthesis)
MNRNGPQKVFSPGRALPSRAQESANLTLKLKALEVIALTPDLRCERVQAIKELVARGSYHCNAHQVAVKLIADHLSMTGLLAGQPGTGLSDP